MHMRGKSFGRERPKDSSIRISTTPTVMRISGSVAAARAPTSGAPAAEAASIGRRRGAIT